MPLIDDDSAPDGFLDIFGQRFDEIPRLAPGDSIAVCEFYGDSGNLPATIGAVLLFVLQE